MAHARKIDRKSLHEYKRKLTIPHQSLHPQDARAIQHFKENLPPNGLILALKNEGFTGHLPRKLVDDIHALPHIWQSPYAAFNDSELQATSSALMDCCIRLGRTLATKTFGAKGGGDYYEVPPEYEEDVFYKEVDALQQDARSVCNAFDALVRLAIAKGLDF